MTRRDLLFVRKVFSGSERRPAPVPLGAIDVPQQVFESVRLRNIPPDTSVYRWKLRWVPIAGSTLQMFMNTEQGISRMAVARAESKASDDAHHLEVTLSPQRPHADADNLLVLYWVSGTAENAS